MASILSMISFTTTTLCAAHLRAQCILFFYICPFAGYCICIIQSQPDAARALPLLLRALAIVDRPAPVDSSSLSPSSSSSLPFSASSASSSDDVVEVLALLTTACAALGKLADAIAHAKRRVALLEARLEHLSAAPSSPASASASVLASASTLKDTSVLSTLSPSPLSPQSASAAAAAQSSASSATRTAAVRRTLVAALQELSTLQQEASSSGADGADGADEAQQQRAATATAERAVAFAEGAPIAASGGSVEDDDEAIANISSMSAVARKFGRQCLRNVFDACCHIIFS
jgi:hypothetical protein